MKFIITNLCSLNYVKVANKADGNSLFPIDTNL